MSPELGRALLDEARERLVKGFPAQVVACLDLLGDEQIWWRANDGSNSVGNLVLHVCGSSRHFLGRALGGSDYVRDRPREFAERGPLPKDFLKQLVRETAEETGRVLEQLDPARRLEVTDRVLEDRVANQPGAEECLLGFQVSWREWTIRCGANGKACALRHHDLPGSREGDGVSADRG